MHRQAHFSFTRRTVLIRYGVSCILVVETNNFYRIVSDSEKVYTGKLDPAQVFELLLLV